MFGHARGRPPEELVAPGRAVAADDVDLSSRASHRCGEVAQQVEKPGIQGGYIARSVISQKMIELVNGSGKIRIAKSVNDTYPLVGMQMEQQQSVLLRGKVSCCNPER